LPSPRGTRVGASARETKSTDYADYAPNSALCKKRREPKPPPENPLFDYYDERIVCNDLIADQRQFAIAANRVIRAEILKIGCGRPFRAGFDVFPAYRELAFAA
jgi:hypothetical protein